MLVFHEGLPRAGKSWEAIHFQLVPAIKAGRHVTVNIRGVNPDRIAEVYELDVETVKSLITQVPWEESKDIHKYAKPNGLVILDEVQDFFPPKCPLTSEQTEFITQHGQFGMDIVLCGQDYKDMHAFWRNRVQRVIYFKKMAALGKEASYQWKVAEKSGRDRFAVISSGVRKYEAKLYDCYASHRDGVENKGNLQDDRANLFKSPLFRVILPVCALVAAVSIWWLYNFFTKPSKVPGTKIEAHQQADKPVPEKAIEHVAKQAEAQPVKGAGVAEATANEPAEYVASMFAKYRPRLAVYMTKASGEMEGLIQLLDEGYKVREEFHLSDLYDFGWTFEAHKNFVVVRQGNKRGVVHTVTPWTVDEWGRGQSPTGAKFGDKSVPPPQIVAQGQPETGPQRSQAGIAALPDSPGFEIQEGQQINARQPFKGTFKSIVNG